MRSTSILCSALTSAAMLAGAAAHAQTQFTYQKISVPNAFWTIALDVTDDGRVSGWTTDFIHVNGFVESNSVYSPVNVPGFSATQVTAINGSTLYGVVNENLGFSLDAKGNVTVLKGSNFGPLPNGVNKNGVVVGKTQVFQGNQPAFLLQNGTYQTYLAPSSNVTSFNAINDQGVIVGTANKNGGPLSSFKLQGGEQTPIVFPGAYSTIVTGIDDAGETVGWYSATPQAAPQIFFYDGKSYSTVPNPPNAYACTGVGHLNNLRQFVVSCGDQQTGQQVSFLATPAEGTSITLPQQ